MATSRLEGRVRAVWSALGNPPPGLVVAVSGGPDSVALACALLEARPGETPLVLAHLNHQLRGGDSADDEAFVHDFAGRVGLPLICHRLDVAALARGDNLEATARRERYRWLAEVARSRSLRFVATGHNANDQAETVLHRLLRGAGLDGLRGIAARRALEDGIEVVRPLLDVTRNEIMAYLAELGQEARHDASNDDVRFTRNRLRHELLPLLARDYNPRIVEVLGRLARQADEAAREEDAQAADLLRRAEMPRAGATVVLDAGVLRTASRREVRAALRVERRREAWPMDRMTFTDYDRVAALAEVERGAHDLSGGVQARREGRVLRLSTHTSP
ncbi:MAG: tRNA lysidine(34) synthetase TilS [Gemmataceae bacterium]